MMKKQYITPKTEIIECCNSIQPIMVSGAKMTKPDGSEDVSAPGIGYGSGGLEDGESFAKTHKSWDESDFDK